MRILVKEKFNIKLGNLSNHLRVLILTLKLKEFHIHLTRLKIADLFMIFLPKYSFKTTIVKQPSDTHRHPYDTRCFIFSVTIYFWGKLNLQYLELNLNQGLHNLVFYFSI